MDEYEDSESDDDFDETTLWEIASLLNSEDVPSKSSLLPRPRDIIEDYDEEDETEFEEDSGAEEAYQKGKAEQRPLTKLPIMPLVMSSKVEPNAEPKEESKLWEASVTSTLASLDTGLPQPEPSVWYTYIPSSENAVRSKPRASEKLSALASRDLWAVSGSEAASVSADRKSVV